MTTPGRDRRAMLSGLALSCAATIAGFLVWSWPLAAHLSTHTLVLDTSDPAALASSAEWKLILANDQNLSLWGAVENARAFARADLGGLMSQGQCYPMPLATALGEHMFELGLLALPAWLVSGDPVVAYNLSLALALLIAAAGMFLFLWPHTGSVAASVAGALAFAMSVPRLVDLPIHPAVVGTHWLPWVLWSFDRILAGRRGGVPAFALTLLLSSIVGSYPLMAVGIVGAAYAAVVLALRARTGRLAASSVVWSAVAALPALAAAATIVLTYASLQQQWMLPVNTGPKFLVRFADYLPGGAMPVGLFALAGLVPALLLRGSCGRSAAAGLSVAAVVAFALTTRIDLPGVAAWSLYETLAQHFALFDAVRGPGKTALAVCFCVQALGAIGWSRVLSRVPVAAGAAIGVLLTLLVMLEVEAPAWMRGWLGAGATMTLREVAPPRDRIETLLSHLGDARDRRAVLDLPIGRMVRAPRALLDAAWHGHPTSACYNSLVPPTARAVATMATRARSGLGVAELAAAGFGTIIERAGPGAPLSASAFAPPARLLAFEADLAIWGLPHPAILHRDVSRLELRVLRGRTRAQALTAEPPFEMDVEVRNRDDAMWAAPRPLAPLIADVTLSLADGTSVLRTTAHGVLPPALSPGAATTMQLLMPEAPPRGSYLATVASQQARIEAGAIAWSDESEAR